MITKTQQAVVFNADATIGSHRITAQVKTSIDGTTLLCANGTILLSEAASDGGECYVGSFTITDSSQTININSSDRALLTLITESVASFSQQLLLADQQS